SILKVLVFPAPLTPNKPKHSPFWTVKHSRSTARKSEEFSPVVLLQHVQQIMRLRIFESRLRMKL
uniref:Uncharacterized protein n=1 Tax=Romanomermis culicivorax TaxID=13658 RepID=A0A915L0L6_ROMCU